MKKKGFTLVELLVVIAIIALLMGILMPALARVRAIAFRMVCGSNLSGIGKAMLIYANDYEDEFPRAGIKGSQPTLLTLAANTKISDWMGAAGSIYGDRAAAFLDGKVTMTSCLFLLIKYAEVTPKSFVCKGDSGTTEFKLSDEDLTGAPTDFELIDAWDFGLIGPPTKRCSYAYHQPFPIPVKTYNYALTTSSDPGMAVAADRNPWLIPAGAPVTRAWTEFMPGPTTVNGVGGGTSEQQIKGNSDSHGMEGQNVLFLDSHVYFEKRAYCAVDDDNIYTYWLASTKEKRLGTPPSPASGATNVPKGKTDSYLVNNK
jgi:prepilin-type N-terminal cleavage/methylation domain-containing protein